MLQEIRDYAKCAAKNKFIRTSYAALVIGCAASYLGHELHNPPLQLLGSAAAINGSFALLLTQGGRITYDCYKSMKLHIQNHGTIEPRFRDTFEDTYCAQTGIRLAAKEAGLEALLDPKD